jgi:hypothetical protein
MSNERTLGTQRPITILAAALLLGSMFLQVATSIPRLSITFDEDLHISTGYSVLRTGDLRLVEDHPPLLGYWMSWPLLLTPEVPDPEDVPDWTRGDRRLFVRNEVWWNVPLDLWVVPPRIPVALLTLVLGAVLFRWASEWFGPRGGLLALALLAFDPNVLANSSLATLDMGVAVLMFITMYGVHRITRRPTTANLIGTGVLLGLALSAKVSAVILLPISAGVLFLWGLRHWRKKLVVRLLLYLGAAFLTLWAVHLFDFGTPEGLSFSLPAPTYFHSFLRVGRHVARGNRAFLLGETYEGGRWIYFPIAFVLKTPLPALVLLGIALVWVWRPPRQLWREFVLASLPVSYFLVSMFNSINLGYRHLLPVVPFMYLFIARLASPICRSAASRHRVSELKGWLREGAAVLPAAGLALLLLWQVAGTLRVWPFYITFFNEIVGGPRNGYRYLADSNVDWGQGLKELRGYLEEQDWADPKLSSFTWFIRPELYGIEATPLPPLAEAPALLPTRFNPTPGTYVISASTLRGLQLVDPEMYNWFWHREPDDVVANAMLIYTVKKREPEPTWLAQCLVPVAPLPPEASSEGFGRGDLRRVYFDCTQSWLVPGGGRAPGWYALYRDTAVSGDAFIDTHLEPYTLSFEQKRSSALPPFVIYEAASIPIAPDQPSPTPTQVGELTFLGHSLQGPSAASGERSLEIWTYWRVDGVPNRPLSLMLHLIGPGGAPAVVGDGLGVPVEGWQVGDVIVQRHRLALPHDAPAGDYALFTGAYWLDSLERWPVVQRGQETGDQVALPTIQVEAP